MKRKVKRYDEGGGIFGGIKEGLSRVFRRDEDSPKFSDLESVGGAGRRQKTIEEQIKGRPGRENEGKEYAPYRREPEPSKGSTLKPEPESPKGGTTYTNEEYSGDKKAIERDVMDVKPEKEAKPAKVIKAESKVAPKVAPKSEEAKPAPRVSPKKSIGEDLKPAPAKPSAKKEEPKPLPGKPEPKAKVTPYSLEKKISKEEEAEGERGKRMEAEAAAQQKKNKEEAKAKVGGARTRAGTPVKSQSEPSAEAKAKAMASLAAKIKKQDEENRFNFSPSKSPNRSYKSGGSVQKYGAGGLTPAERKAMLDEKVAPPRGTTKKEADIFKPGMKPPVDDDMGSAKPVKKAKGGMARSASSRADGCAIRGKTRA